MDPLDLFEVSLNIIEISEEHSSPKADTPVDRIQVNHP